MRSSMTLLCAALAASFATGCAPGKAYGPSGDDRLDSAVVESLGEGKGAVSSAELSKRRCSDFSDRLAKALNEDLEDGDRLAAYTDLYKDFKGRLDAFDTALKQNPDLAYASSGDGEGAPDAKPAAKLDDMQRECVDAVANIHEEYYKYVRELTEMPTVTDVKGTRKARLSLASLRDAIGVLNSNDKEELLEKVRVAEGQVKDLAPGPDEDEDEKKGKGKKKKGR